jgi:putative hydrolase of the HAD superfamily
MKYRHIFFDLDHTLWDFEANSKATLQQLFTEFDLPGKGITSFDTFHEIYSVHNDKMWSNFRKGHIDRETLRWKRMWLTLVDFKIANEPLALELSKRYLELLPTQREVFPYTNEILDYCQSKGYGIHLITNGFEETQKQKMEHCGIGHYFGEVITSEKAMSLKPRKEIFDYALNVTGAEAATSIMIGDALDIDILGARNAGMDQVFFNPFKTPHKDSPTYEISCLSELKTII